MNVMACPAVRRAFLGRNQLAMAALREACELVYVARTAQRRNLVRRGDTVRLRGTGRIAVRLALAVADVAIEPLLQMRMRAEVLRHRRVARAAHLVEGLLSESPARPHQQQGYSPHAGFLTMRRSIEEAFV